MPDHDPHIIVERRFSPGRLVTGLAAVGIGVGIPLVVGPWHGHVSVDSLIAMALGIIGAGIGLTLVLRPRADFCAPCAARLIPSGLRLRPTSIDEAAASLTAGDPAHALRLAGEPSPDGKWVTIWYCPTCRSTVVWCDEGERIAVSGAEQIVAAVTRPRDSR